MEPDTSSPAAVEEMYTEEEEQVYTEEEQEEEAVLRQDEDQVSSAAQQEVKAVVQDPDVKSSTEGKNGRHTDHRETAAAAAVPRSSVLSWFLVLSLLGVWSSVAVVYFDVVDYNSVIARAKEFRVNFSKVLQGKLSVYDADGDGDFDVEDAKVLLGLNKDGGGSDNGESLEEVLDILAEEGSDWFFGFFTFLYDLVAPPMEAELGEEEAGPPEEEERPIKDARLRKNRLRRDKAVEVSAPEIELPKGLKERPASQGDYSGQTTGTNQDAPAAQTTNEKTVQPEGEGLTEATPTETATDPVYESEDIESAIQAAVSLPLPVEDNFVPDDPRDSAHPYEEQTNSIDTTGVLVEDPPTPETIEESPQHLTSSKVTQQTDSLVEPVEGSQIQSTVAETSTEPGAEVEGVTESQAEEKIKEKAKKKKPKLFNKLDKTIKAEIDAAEKLRKKGKVDEALRAFEALVQQYPQSPRALFGKAQCEDDLAEKQRSNDLLQKAINTYRDAAELPAATPDLLRAALKKRAERQQFLGRMRGSLATLEKLVQIFPEDITLKNDLGVAYLLLGDNKGAKKVYQEVLEASPSDGFAKVHYGFILKSENQIAESIPYLKAGLESGDPGTDDGRFYFHLGDALQRMGDKSAYHWYELGHQRGHFASVWQRSLYNVKGLKAQPWWTPKETGYTDLVKSLERSWRAIREEAESVMNLTSSGLFVPEEENLRETGDWGQFTLWQQGRKAGDACRSVPKTCALLERFPEATGCKRGQIKFSVMKPGTHVWPHTGPTNCRLRMHLGLVVPKHGCSIRCTDETRHWEEGKVLIFDDSFEHEVWQEADSYRLILIVDVWHPQLTAQQRQTLSPI